MIYQVFDGRKIDRKKYIGSKQGQVGSSRMFVACYHVAIQISVDGMKKPSLEKDGYTY
jgi:hypothetical protein